MRVEWQELTALPWLGPDELQLFQINLNETVENIEIYKECLSTAEIERSARLRVGQVRDQFVVGRTCLRILLGNLLGLSPCDVSLALSAFGKPEVAANGRALHFNVAHSREVILIALCRSSPVGVDLEHMDRDTDALELARTAFTPGETLQIEQIADPVERQRAFFRGWTRKEAVVKADGRGLSLPLDSFEVPIFQAAQGTPVLVTEDDGGAAGVREWLVTDIFLDEDFAAACAVGRRELDICGFHLRSGLLPSRTHRL